MRSLLVNDDVKHRNNRTYGNEWKTLLDTDATCWEPVLVKPHAPRPGTK
jgi:hypothetical protein